MLSGGERWGVKMMKLYSCQLIRHMLREVDSEWNEIFSKVRYYVDVVGA